MLASFLRLRRVLQAETALGTTARRPMSPATGRARERAPGAGTCACPARTAGRLLVLVSVSSRVADTRCSRCC